MRYKGVQKKKGGSATEKNLYVIRGGWSISYEGVYLKAESLYVDRLGSEQQLPLEKMFLA